MNVLKKSIGLLQNLNSEIEVFLQACSQEQNITTLRPLVEAYEGEDWKEYVAFSENCYTRNYVVRRPSHEILILCWDQGQQSPVHNHASQGCLLKVLRGRLEEVRYTFHGRIRNLYYENQVSYIDDGIGFHQIINPGPEKAISLHIYAPGYFEPQIFDKTTSHSILL